MYDLLHIETNEYGEVLPTVSNAQKARKILKERGGVSLKIASEGTQYHIHFMNIAHSSENIDSIYEDQEGTLNFMDGSNGGLMIAIDRKKCYGPPCYPTNPGTHIGYYAENLGIYIGEELGEFLNEMRIRN